MSELSCDCDTPFIGRNETLDLSLYQMSDVMSSDDDDGVDVDKLSTM